ncbi:MAG: hypothetical protein AAB288_10750, partial [Acidobacteriota bacterium]
VEISLRIKELLYEELYTIAGARKKLQNEIRENGKSKNGDAEPAAASSAKAEPGLFDEDIHLGPGSHHAGSLTEEGRDAIRSLGSQLLELREMLKTSQTNEASEHLRNY